MIENLKYIQDAIDEFNIKYPRPAMDKIALDELYDLDLEWPKPWKCKSGPGVYIFLDSNGVILYIGKSSYHIPSRFKTYFQYDKEDRAKHVAVSYYSKETKYILSISIPFENRFEAPAIEEYLILKLKPVRNKVNTI